MEDKRKKRRIVKRKIIFDESSEEDVNARQQKCIKPFPTIPQKCTLVSSAVKSVVKVTSQTKAQKEYLNGNLQ